MSEGNGAPERKRYTKRFKEQLVDIEESDGQVRTYKLKDVSGPARDEFIEFRDACMEDGKLKKGAMNHLIAKLLSKTLYDPEGVPVEEGEVLGLPSEIQLGLFEDAAKLCGFDKLAYQAAKNA